MIKIKFCSVCGKELVTPIKRNKQYPIVYCSTCWAHTKNGFKILNKDKYFCTDENLQDWK